MPAAHDQHREPGTAVVRPSGCCEQPPVVDPHLPSSLSASLIGRPSVWRLLQRFVFLLGLGLLAGLIAGFPGIGPGSRVAMRIVALRAGHGHYSEITDAEAVAGQITLDGTGFLGVAGTVVGVPGGLLYVAGYPVRRYGRAWRSGDWSWPCSEASSLRGTTRTFAGSCRRSSVCFCSPSSWSFTGWSQRLNRGGGAPPPNHFSAVGGYAMLAVAVIVGGAKDFQALAEIF